MMQALLAKYELITNGIKFVTNFFSYFLSFVTDIILSLMTLMSRHALRKEYTTQRILYIREKSF